MLSARQAVSTSGSGMAARSELMPIPQVSRCESNATLTAAPEVGPKPYSRRTSAPANQLRSWLPGTLVATKSMPFNIDPKIEVVTSRGRWLRTPARTFVSPTAGSCRHARAIAPRARMRSAGSSIAAGSAKRTGVNRFPPGASPFRRVLIGIVTRSSSSSAPWRSW